MEKPKKLASGNWRIRIFYEVNGKRVAKSFTDPDRKKVELEAAQFELALQHQRRKPMQLTVGEAIDRYIESKTAILSPATIREYKNERESKLQAIMDVKLHDLTQEMIQRAVNSDAKKCNAKTVKNAHGLLTAALSEYHPDFRIKTKLPQKKKANMQIPEDKDISFLTSKCSGTELETAILFAATLGLRRSEICALTWDDINFEAGTVRIDKAVVLDHEKEWVGKGTKTYSSTRTLNLSSILIEHLAKLPRKGDRILSVNPDALTNRFCRLRSQCGFSFRFHDLRHYNASVMLAEGIPDKYAMGQLGHATPNMLQNVYQHLMQGKKSETAITLNNYMDAAFGKKDADATPLPDHT